MIKGEVNDEKELPKNNFKKFLYFLMQISFIFDNLMGKSWNKFDK